MTTPDSTPAPAGKDTDDTALRCARALSADMDAHRKAMEHATPKKAYGLGRAARVIREVLAAETPPAPKPAAPAPKPPKDPAAPKPDRPRDSIFDALALAAGMDLAEVTKGAGGEIAAAKRDILAVCPDVTPAEIKRRAGKLAAKWTGVAVTPSSLAKHWGEFSGKSKKTDERPPLEVAPIGWVAKLHRIYPDSVYIPGGKFEVKPPGTDYQWSQLPQVVRDTIKGAKP